VVCFLDKLFFSPHMNRPFGHGASMIGFVPGITRFPASSHNSHGSVIEQAPSFVGYCGKCGLGGVRQAMESAIEASTFVVIIALPSRRCDWEPFQPESTPTIISPAAWPRCITTRTGMSTSSNPQVSSYEPWTKELLSIHTLILHT